MAMKSKLFYEMAKAKTKTLQTIKIPNTWMSFNCFRKC